jgi:hypothetical protein
MLAACVWLAMGYSAQPSLFALLRRLPIYDVLRYPERFLIPGALFFAALAATGLTSLRALMRKRKWRWASRAWAVSLALLLANLPFLIWNFSKAASDRHMVAAPEQVSRPFRQARGNRWALAYFTPLNRGSLSCWDAYPVPQSAQLRGDLPLEEYLKDPAAGELFERSWSPNRIELIANLTRPTSVLVNQNHHTGWRSSVGSVVNDDGLLAVELPAGQHRLTLRFLPRSAVTGAAATFASLIAAGVWWRKRRAVGAREWVLMLAVSAAPLACGATAYALWSEPDYARLAPTGPENEPLVADMPPPGAKVVGAVFEGGAELQAVSVDERPNHEVRVELDWKVKDSVARDLGIFVHIEPESGKRLTADHPQVSDAFFFEAAPAGKTLRDIMIISVPPEHRTLDWKIWVGLWTVRGDGRRMAVIDANGATIHENRVLAGTVERAKEPPAP